MFKYPTIYEFNSIGETIFTDNMVSSLKKRLKELLISRINQLNTRKLFIKTIGKDISISDIEKFYIFVLSKNRRKITWTYSDYKVNKLSSYLLVKTVEYGTIQSHPVYFFRKVHNQLISDFNNGFFF